MGGYKELLVLSIPQGEKEHKVPISLSVDDFSVMVPLNNILSQRSQAVLRTMIKLLEIWEQDLQQQSMNQNISLQDK